MAAAPKTSPAPAQLLDVPAPLDEPGNQSDDPKDSLKQPCPSCGGTMIVIETFEAGEAPPRPAWRHPARAPPDSQAARP